MMGTKAWCFTPVPDVSLEELVPADHFYRHVDRVLDFSFVRDLVQRIAALIALGPALEANYAAVKAQTLAGAATA